ncbi:MAG: MarR family transcriptional regulator [Caldilineaceae bacterium]|nr:MarR family transcriptional regulator [Caldilineaceae bacterium]
MSIEASIEDWELLAQVCQGYRNLSNALMDQIEMHRAQATLLCHLFKQEGMTQSEIADQLSVRGATVTNMLQRMEEAGLVTRRRDVEDHRLVRVYLTDEGKNKERSIVQQFVNVEETIFEGLTQEDRASLRQMLRLMLDNMHKGG